MALADAAYLPLIGNGIEDFAVFTLKDAVERDDDCGHVYHKSLLYLVSDAFEDTLRVGREGGTPLLGMEKFLRARPDWVQALGERWVLSPSDAPDGSPRGAGAKQHGGFDDDPPAVRALVARILGRAVDPARVAFDFNHSAQRQREIRQTLMGVERR